MNDMEQLAKRTQFCREYEKNALLDHAKGRVRIQYGWFSYSHFSVCFLHDMLGQILECLYQGYIPQIDYVNQSGRNIWEMFFDQPYAGDAGLQALPYAEPEWSAGKRIDTCWEPYYSSVTSEYAKWLSRKLYRDWVSIKDSVFDYIAWEYRDLIQGKNVLGILCRGTDLARMKPVNHPRQPEVSEVIG